MLRSRLLACLLVVLTILGTSGVWHVDAGDPDFGTPQVHDHSAHHERWSRADDENTAPTHCALCHWLQAFRVDSTASSRIEEPAVVRASFLVRTPRFLRAFALLDLPPRAPPLA